MFALAFCAKGLCTGAGAEIAGCGFMGRDLGAGVPVTPGAAGVLEAAVGVADAGDGKEWLASG